MNHFKKLKKQITWFVFFVVAMNLAIILVAWWLSHTLFAEAASTLWFYGLLLAAGLIVAYFSSVAITEYVIEPVDFLWRAIVHVSPGHTTTPAPNLESSRVGNELIRSLVLEVYQLAASSPYHSGQAPTVSGLAEAIVHNVPVPLFALDKNQNVVSVNDIAAAYINTNKQDVVGKNFYSLTDLSFSNEDTYDSWLKDCRDNKATANNIWTHVRMKNSDQVTLKQFDMAAYYSKDNSAGIETIVTLFDQTEAYNADDQSMGFIALAVHELRTPLTMLRGYIEVFEDEIGTGLEPEMNDFMQKMNASAQQLSSFVNNILNVARVEENQLTLQLTEEDWTIVIRDAINDLSLRAQVHGKTIECTIDDNLPKAGVDKVSIYEVINNLIDNAIKYSSSSSKIVVHSRLNQEGLIETTVQDFGVGLNPSTIPYLFEKFQRNHRTRAQVGGTGLGLYLSKAIVTAHGGNIWVTSKEGEGSTFGFTVLPYAQLADEVKNSDNKDIVRGAHGWIKNHSLYRR